MSTHSKITVFFNDGKSLIPKTGIYDLVIHDDGVALIVWQWSRRAGEKGETPEKYKTVLQTEIQKLPTGAYFLPKAIQGTPPDAAGNIE